ncbi:MAG: methyl-accepting chemotaxis protein [Castellaniella sp.]|uniref:methyl-accepting chemotaxis protein n=1 Tax=Castellaniella sp. TaxID=1955812 RepID=UPI003C761908
MIALGFIVTVLVMVRQASSMQTEAAYAYVEALARQEAGVVEQDIERAMAAVRTMAQTWQGLRASGPGDREASLNMLREVLAGNPTFLGVWQGWEPDAFDAQDRDYANKPGHDATGRFIPYWYWEGGKPTYAPIVDYDQPGKGDYYLLARDTGRPVLLEPFAYPVGGREEMMTSIAIPIQLQGKTLGVAGADLGLQRFQERVAAIRPYETGYAGLISQGNRLLAHPTQDMVGTLIEAGSKIGQAIKKGGVQEYIQYNETLGTDAYTVVVPVAIAGLDQVWSFYVSVPLDRVLAQVADMRNVSLALGLASILIVSLVLAWFLNRLVIRPLGGEPADAAGAATRIAQGDLSTSIQVDERNQGSMLYAMRTMQSQLGRLISGIRENSESVSTAATQIAQGNTDLSQRTEEQAAALQETAASLEELAATVRQNADNANRANGLADNAARMVGEGNAAVSEIVVSMHAMADSAQRMKDIIATIEGIAFQTNILALNAAVEAARAGEEGRGFAVVAGEVRTLAQRSTTAAQEIKGLIESSVTQAEDSARQVDHANQVIGRVVSAIREVTELMREIASASGQQSDGLSQINVAVSQMDSVTQQNAALVEEASAAAASLQDQANRLVSAVSVFKV